MKHFLILITVFFLTGMSKPVNFTTPEGWCSIEFTTPTALTDESSLTLSEIVGYSVFHDGVEQPTLLIKSAVKKSWKPEGKCPKCVQLITVMGDRRLDSFKSSCLNKV